ncbi:hypothetical protein JRQ81_000213 [Phrynocephalus forsythii]|uniref:Inner centromere protein n=1 Tax=Phrynocephalus forsythii TaxID=171643 RepID=A0A9Q0Y8D5_9SAUR|nr:hypothetical protein JRQ81_000213 [Phrynocephalus forsythii]
MVHLVTLEEEAQKKLKEFLQNVNDRNFVWMDEVLEEAIKMFSSDSSGEPLLMPKTPSQKNRQKKKRLSSVKNDQFSKKRLSKRYSTRSSSSKQIAQNLQHRKDSDIIMIDAENSSPCHRVTRSRAMRSARPSQDTCKKMSIDLAKGRVPLVEISANERHSAELQMEKTPPQTETVAGSISLFSNGKSPIKKSQPCSKVSLIVIPDTPEAKMIKEPRGASKLKIANVPIPKTPEKKEANPPEENMCVQQQDGCQPCETEAVQNSAERPQTPAAPNANRQSVRRSLMGGRPSMNCRVSLAESCSLSAKREKLVRKSLAKRLSKRKTYRQSSAACKCIRCTFHHHHDTAVWFGRLLSTVAEKLRMSLRSHKANMAAAVQSQGDQQGAECKDNSSGKGEDVQEQPQIIKRQSSYKRALGINDGPGTEEKLSPPRKKAPSPQYLSSKVSRPFKTFLHTVHKNQVLMMTPGSVSRNNTIKSFLKQNTPLRTTPQEKERQRFENLRKKEEAEQQRRQKLEEEKKRRMEEAKRKREERLRKVLQARERVERLEEEKKKRFEQKRAQYEERNDKVREDKLAEDKLKKAAAAKKLEELEARRKQEEEARKQKALQLEEEEHRHRELMQKRKEEEEQEKARKIAEQRRAELEREKNLSAERELQRKKEQERLQAQQEHERQEKEKAARLQREVLAAAKEKERSEKNWRRKRGNWNSKSRRSCS